MSVSGVADPSFMNAARLLQLMFAPETLAVCTYCPRYNAVRCRMSDTTCGSKEPGLEQHCKNDDA